MGAAMTRSPSRSSPRITSFQLEPSAQAPWTATTVLVSGTLTLKSFSSGHRRDCRLQHLRTEKLPNTFSDESAGVLKSEMAGIKEV